MSDISTTRLRDRIFAGFGALLFLGVLILTVALYVSSSKDTTTTTDTATETCSEESITADKETVPSTYVPTGTITALEQTDLTVGTGQTAKDGDCLQVKYYGTLASNGTKFDENYDEASAFQFELGKSEVITGWDTGLVGMKVGGTRRLVIPASQAYGDQAQSSIPANSDLVFVVELLQIK